MSWIEARGLGLCTFTFLGVGCPQGGRHGLGQGIYLQPRWISLGELRSLASPSGLLEGPSDYLTYKSNHPLPCYSLSPWSCIFSIAQLLSDILYVCLFAYFLWPFPWCKFLESRHFGCSVRCSNWNLDQCLVHRWCSIYQLTLEQCGG